MQKNKQDLVSLAELSPENLREIILLAKELKANPLSKKNSLAHKSIALIFAKPSLRTRISFEVGINQLGGNPITIKMEEINIGKREDVIDTASVLSRYVDGIVIRTFEQEQIEQLAKYSSVPVINGLSNDEHPCQIISDFFTIEEHFKSLKDIKIAFIGDGNNIAQSLMICSALANTNISIAGPKSYEPNDSYIKLAKKINPKITIAITNDPKEAAKGAKVLYTDTWISMGQEEESEKRKMIFSPYQVNNELLSLADKDVIVLHCLPAHKGEEITQDVFKKFSKIIYKQAENRLHAQKAILLKLLA